MMFALLVLHWKHAPPRSLLLARGLSGVSCWLELHHKRVCTLKLYFSGKKFSIFEIGTRVCYNKPQSVKHCMSGSKEGRLFSSGGVLPVRPKVERNPNVEQWEVAENQLYLARNVTGHCPDYRAFFPFAIRYQAGQRIDDFERY
jgi:hypothetical protein